MHIIIYIYYSYLHVKIMEFATFHAKQCDQILCISPSSPHGINYYGLCLYLFKEVDGVLLKVL